jgi:hypothetical protein
LIFSCGFHEITRMINGIDDLYGILFGVNKVNPMILRVFLVGSLWGCSEVKKQVRHKRSPILGFVTLGMPLLG